MTLQTTDYVASCPILSRRSHFLLALDCSPWTPWQLSSIGQLIPVSSAASFPGSSSLFKLAHRVPLLKTKNTKWNCHSVLGVPVATFLSLTFLSDSSILKVLCLLFSPLPQLFVILPPTRVCGICLLPFHGNCFFLTNPKANFVFSPLTRAVWHYRALVALPPICELLLRLLSA